MSPEDTLVYEARNRSRQMAIAGAAGVLLMVGAIVGLVGPHAPVSELTLSLVYEHKRVLLSILAAAFNGAAQITIGATLLYLWRCASARSDRAMPWVPVVVVIGVVLGLIGGLGYAIEFSVKSGDFVSTGLQTYDEANRLTGGPLLLILQIVSQLGALLIAVAFIIVALIAMRVGLLPRFLAYVGMFAGVLVLFPIIVVPVVQLYWLVAVAILLSGNWPSGLPPAWRSGRAEPWPSSAEMRARRAAQTEATRGRRAEPRRGRRARVSDAPAPVSDAAPATLPAADAEARTRAATPKRKRKRKH